MIAGGNSQTASDQERQVVAVHQRPAVAGGSEDRQPDRGAGRLAGGEQRPGHAAQRPPLTASHSAAEAMSREIREQFERS
jgi:hypothetical protein